MGHTAEAKLVYGVDLGEYPEFKAVKDENGEDDYDKIEAAEEASGASIVNYGFERSYTMLGFECASVDWGARLLKPEDMAADPSWDDKIRDLARRLGFKLLKKHKFGWHIAALYG